MRSKSKYAQIMQNADVKRWYNNNRQGSEITADVYLRRIGAFCNQHKLSPSSLAKKSQNDLYNLLLEYVSAQEKNGYAGSYTHSTIKAVKSWLGFNNIQITRRIKVKGAFRASTLDDESVPSQEDLRKVILATPSNNRVSCILMAHTGVRPETLGNYLGNDGLRIRDFPEMKIEGATISFATIPTMVVVRPELSKTEHRYFSFLSDEGCEYLRAYLEERIKAGEQLRPDSDIIHPKVAGKQFITANNIGDGIRKAIRKAGFKWRPYVLRAYFDTQLLFAESKGKITHAYRQFFMGHMGDIEARYTTNKGRLPKELIEDMRNAYSNCQPFLQTSTTRINQDDLAVTLRKQLFTFAGYSAEEIEAMDLKNMEDSEIHRLTFGKMVQKAMNNGHKQKVVDAKDVERYIDEGWEYINALPNGKVILKLPV